jgi:response regulator RpfG family c-di-GMP phosphodiesterase
MGPFQEGRNPFGSEGEASVKTNLLDNKRVLIVDDEPDILATLADLLHMCQVVKASTFEESKDALETQYFDVAILDIMGVKGYELLEIANKKKVIAVMLTAHALSPEDTAKSYREGAALYVPKEAMADITTYLNDVLEAKEAGRSFWWRWLDRFESYYDKKFGSEWKKKDEDFWKKINYI